MVQHANNVLVGNSELGLEPLNLNPDIQEGFSQVIALLQGFKKQSAVYGNIRINRDNLLISVNSQIYPESFVSRNYLLSTAIVRYKPENTARKALYIKNLGGSRITFANSQQAMSLTRSYMYAGQYVLLEEYTFELWMKSLSNSIVQVLEYY